MKVAKLALAATLVAGLSACSKGSDSPAENSMNGDPSSGMDNAARTPSDMTMEPDPTATGADMGGTTGTGVDTTGVNGTGMGGTGMGGTGMGGTGSPDTTGTGGAPAGGTTGGGTTGGGTTR